MWNAVHVCRQSTKYWGYSQYIRDLRSIFSTMGIWCYGLATCIGSSITKKVTEQIKQPLCVIFDTNYVLQKRCKIL